MKRGTRTRPDARQLARRAMTAQVAEMAIELFVEHGYESTTVDDICEVAGISRSTFFRYFRSKEDVLMAELADAGDLMLAALENRPGAEAPWLSIRHAVVPLIERYADQPERILRSARLIKATPALATLHHEKLAGWREVLRPEVARRLGASPDDSTDPRPDALIAAALGCLDAAVAAWAAADGTQPLTQLFDQAMDAIR